MKLSRKIEIKYNWWTDEEDDATLEIISTLKEHAKERITKMTDEGYTSGELLTDIDNVSYRGWFEINYV